MTEIYVINTKYLSRMQRNERYLMNTKNEMYVMYKPNEISRNNCLEYERIKWMPGT